MSNVIEVFQGQLSFTEVLPLMGGTSKSEVPVRVLLGGGNRAVLVERCKTQWAQGRACFLAFPTVQLPLEPNFVLALEEELGEIVYAPILAIGKYPVMDEYGFERNALGVTVDLNKIKGAHEIEIQN